MTEQEWLSASDPGTLLSVSLDKPRRKALLFGAVCCRRIWVLLIHPASRTAIEVVERFADGGAERAELADAAEGARHASDLAHKGAGIFASTGADGPASYEVAAYAAYKVARPARPVGWALMRQAAEAALEAAGLASEAAEQTTLIRDIFGNPFRPVLLDPSWRTSVVLSLAECIYADRAFDRLPILADALQDAGCDNAAILDHCRGPGPHARGCWVVDLILGKS